MPVILPLTGLEYQNRVHSRPGLHVSLSQKDSGIRTVLKSKTSSVNKISLKKYKHVIPLKGQLSTSLYRAIFLNPWALG